MEPEITKLVEFVWDRQGDCWREKMTGIRRDGILPVPISAMGIPMNYHGSGSVLDKPIERTIVWNGIERTIVWDGPAGCWRDIMTGVRADGMAAPAAQELVDAGHPWRDTFGVPLNYHGSGPLLCDPPVFESPSHEAVQAMINKAFEARIVGERMPYFAPEGGRLITYTQHRGAIDRLSEAFNTLNIRIEQLEQPWWRRWFR
jgi:hypothetical protein